MEKFNKFDILTDGDFVGIYISASDNIPSIDFYFGISSHKDWWFHPIYLKDSAMPLRRVTDKELAEFIDDTEKLFGYRYNPETHMFEGYPYNTIGDFRKAKKPQYISFSKFTGRRVVRQLRVDEDYFWLFDDGTYTEMSVIDGEIQIRYDDTDDKFGENLMYGYLSESYMSGDDDEIATELMLRASVNKLIELLFDGSSGELNDLGRAFIETGQCDIDFLNTIRRERYGKIMKR